MKNRTPYGDSALFVVKGAIAAVWGIPLGRTTKSVKFSKSDVVTITVGPIEAEPTETQMDELNNCIREKILDDTRFRVFDISREKAEELYGEAFYDDFGIPQSVTQLQLIGIDKWSINANRFPVLKSTGLIGSISVTKTKHNETKNTLEITFVVTPPACASASPPAVAPSPEGSTEQTSPATATYEQMAADCGVDVGLIAPKTPTTDMNYPSASEILPGSEGIIAEDDKQKVTAWDVNAEEGIDYNRLIKQFGCQAISTSLIARIEALGGGPAHHFLKREIMFSHRDLNNLLDAYEKGRPFYVYTGRGPSSQSMHFGHIISFMFTKWLQDFFKVPVVIQLTDDEKFIFKENISVEEAHRLGFENAKDIIACGFDVKKTFIFSDLDYIQHMYPLVLKIQKKVTASQVRGIFGFTESDNIGKYGFPAVQAAPSFSKCFPKILEGREEMRCLIPQGIDQDPYFRMTRDVAPRLGYLKPALIHSKFFPALQGFKTKMSGSVASSSIYLSDSEKEITEKIMKYAFSGGQATEAEQRAKGADLDVDVPYQYLRHVMDDDATINDIGEKYSTGKLLTGEVKQILIKTLVDFVKRHQEARSNVTDDMVRAFMDPNRSIL